MLKIFPISSLNNLTENVLMPAIVDHPAFVQPDDKAERIWRYMDFAKFVSLLASNALHFSRIDQFSDPFEGSLSRIEYEKLQNLAAAGEADGSIPVEWRGSYFDILMSNVRRSRRRLYVNCWHRSEFESEAMWRLYAPSGLGVAIQSTYSRLVQALPEKVHNGCFVGAVQYTDHHTESIPEGNAFYPAL